MNEPPSRPGLILLVEDDRELERLITAALGHRGHTVEVARNASDLESRLRSRVPELVVLDLDTGDGRGMDLLRSIVETEELVTLIAITADKQVDTAVEAMKAGADHFLTKPFDEETIAEDVASMLGEHRTRRRAAVYRERVARPKTGRVLPNFVGSSPPIHEVRELVAQVAETDSSVVLLGESGTGKGMIARGIHRLSERASASFVDINCASIQPTLLESEIFGYEKGAFTGATARKPGLLEIADGGTLFLDEIAEMEPQAQGKLLTALESGSFRRVGGVKEILVNVRVIAATHHDLEADVGAGHFRQDLYYRLNVFQIALPPLRERLDDLIELTEGFIQELNPVLGRNIERVAPRALELLREYPWPGNVRELRNVVERAMILARGDELKPEHLPANLKKSEADRFVLRSMEEVESEHIRNVLDALDHNVQKAAEVLGFSRSTLYAKMKRYAIERPS